MENLNRHLKKYKSKRTEMEYLISMQKKCKSDIRKMKYNKAKNEVMLEEFKKYMVKK